MRTRNQSQSASPPPSSPVTAAPPSRKRRRDKSPQATAAYGIKLTSNDDSDIFALPVDAAKSVVAAYLRNNKEIHPPALKTAIRAAECTQLLATVIKGQTIATPEDAGMKASALLMLKGEQIAAIHVVSAHRDAFFGTALLSEAKKLQRHLVVSAAPCGTSAHARERERE